VSACGNKPEESTPEVSSLQEVLESDSDVLNVEVTPPEKPKNVNEKVKTLEGKLRESRRREHAPLKRLHREQSRSHSRDVCT